MQPQQVVRESSRIMLEQILPEADHPAWDEMGEDFCRLNRQSLELGRQIKSFMEAKNRVKGGKNTSLNEIPNDAPNDAPNEIPNEIHCQLRQIEQAFDANGGRRL